MTTLLDEKEHPVETLIVLYHERWKEELAIDEAKTHLRNAGDTTFSSLDLIVVRFAVGRDQPGGASAASQPRKSTCHQTTTKQVAKETQKAPKFTASKEEICRDNRHRNLAVLGFSRPSAIRVSLTETSIAKLDTAAKTHGRVRYFQGPDFPTLINILPSNRNSPPEKPNQS